MPEQTEPANIGASPQADEQLDEAELSTAPGWREVFRQAFDKARRQHQAVNRRELGRDRSRSLFLLAGAAMVVVLLLLGVFSSSGTKQLYRSRTPASPHLGRRTPSGQNRREDTGSATPLLNAQKTGPEADSERHDVTAEEVGKTARAIGDSPSAVSVPSTRRSRYALANIRFSDQEQDKESSGAPKPSEPLAASDLAKPSLVFIRDTSTDRRSSGPASVRTETEEVPPALDLPPGTRLMARLQTAVSTAMNAPVVAAIEYNYERDRQIIIPAGSLAFGKLEQASRSGYVAIHFDSLQMPEGSTVKIEATAMSLNFGPLKGQINGKSTTANFLVRTATGIARAASYAVGANDFNAPLSEAALWRAQIATNLGVAGDQQLNRLALNENPSVSLAANTRFYIVIERDAVFAQSGSPATTQTGQKRLPSAMDLEQLMQLQRELDEMYRASSEQNAAAENPRLPQEPD